MKKKSSTTQRITKDQHEEALRSIDFLRMQLAQRDAENLQLRGELATEKQKNQTPKLSYTAPVGGVR